MHVDQILVTGSGSSIDDGPLFGTGSGGNLSITASKLDIEDHARVATQSFGAADGGRISISAPDVTVAGGSEITASAGFAGAGTGNAGSIDIVGRRLTLDGNSDINSSVDGLGAGGKISLNVPQIALTGGSSVSA